MERSDLSRDCFVPKRDFGSLAMTIGFSQPSRMKSVKGRDDGFGSFAMTVDGHHRGSDSRRACLPAGLDVHSQIEVVEPPERPESGGERRQPHRQIARLPQSGVLDLTHAAKASGLANHARRAGDAA